MTDKDYTLFFGGKEENHLRIKLIGLREDVTCLAVLLVRYENPGTWLTKIRFERLWMKDLSDIVSKEWVTELCLDQKDKIAIYVYGLKPEDNIEQGGNFFQVLNIGSVEQRGFFTRMKEIRFGGYPSSLPSFPDYSLIKTEELKLRKSFDPPDTYKLHLPTEHLASNSEVVLFIESDNKIEYLVLMKASHCTLMIPKPVSSRRTYRCIFVELDRENQSYRCHRVATQKVFIVMTKEELLKLMQKAEDYFTQPSRGTHEVKIMFRNKPKAVFDKIMNEKDGLMRKYIKDNNGDKYSPINGNIDGLFFSVSLTESETLPDFSYFGDWRLHVPVEALFQENTNLYFTDFYCHYSGRPHYVTVVLTIPGSETDTFCGETLLLLDEMDNPFLFREDGKVRTTKRLHVEVLYTEDVDIKELQRRYNTGRDELVYFRRSIPRGDGKSTPGGIEKRRGCSVCNL